MNILNFPIVLYRWLIGLPWTGLFFLAQTVFILLDLALIVGLFFVFMRSFALRPKFVFAREAKASIFEGEKFKEWWERILKKAHSSPPQSLALGIIEADSLVDTILKKMQLRGEHMIDRLAELEYLNVKTMSRLLTAHRVRNELAHTPGFVLSETDAKRILEDYESFLHEMGILA